jgi:hypothetical protein
MCAHCLYKPQYSLPKNSQILTFDIDSRLLSEIPGQLFHNRFGNGVIGGQFSVWQRCNRWSSLCRPTLAVQTNLATMNLEISKSQPTSVNIFPVCTFPKTTFSMKTIFLLWKALLSFKCQSCSWKCGDRRIGSLCTYFRNFEPRYTFPR